MILDIETTTDFKKIRLVGVRCGADYHYFVNPVDLRKFLEEHKDETIITWNGCGFDGPLLLNIWNIDIRKYGPLRDGMLFSKMVEPDRYSHALKTFETEDGEEKLEVDYDHASTEELAIYLKRDLDLTHAAWTDRMVRAKKFHHIRPGITINGPLKIEQAVSWSVAQQGFRGIGFDIDKGEQLYRTLEFYMHELEEKAAEWLPTVPMSPSKLDHPPKVQFKGDGTISKYMINWLTRNNCKWDHPSAREFTHKTTGMVYSLPHRTPVSTMKKLTLAQQTELKAWLLKQGWKPTWWNTKKTDTGKVVKTSPRLTHKDTKEPCPGLYKCSSVDGELISNWLTARSRKLSLYSTGKGTGWLKDAERTTTGGYVIHHGADTCGTPTARFRHRVVVNVPRVTTPWGDKMRELFTPLNKENLQVGWDASSLEAVMEAHYVYPFDPAYAKELTEGDVHSRNQEQLGLPSRAKAKELKYALTYGAQAPRVSEILGISRWDAEVIFNGFWETNHGLKELKDKLHAEWLANNKLFVVGLDGRPLFVRSPHSILNTYLQGAGAITMKYAMVIAQAEIRAECGPECFPLIRYHDEEQWECPPELAQRVGEIGVESIERAGRHFDLNVPLTGEYKIGKNWADCH